MLLTYHEGIERRALPDPRDIEATLRDDSPVFLVRQDTFERIPVLVELDATAEDDAERALIIRPHQALDWGTRYVVILRDSLGIEPSEAFRALRDGIETDSEDVERQRSAYTLVHQAIDAQGLDRDEVALAWPFTVRSQEQVVTPLLSMADVVASAPLGKPKIVSDDDVDGVGRVVRGTVEVPNFISPDGIIEVDEDDRAIQFGTRDVEFVITHNAGLDKPRPTLLFGHGFFSHMDETVTPGRSFRRLVEEKEMVSIATNFIGFNADDLTTSIATLADFNRTNQISAQQMQSEVHFIALARIVPELARDIDAIDPDNVSYIGASNGGTQGITIMSVAPNIERGVLVVPGGALTHMLQRAVQWSQLGVFLVERFDDARDLQLGASLLQNNLDPWDSINFIEHLVGDERFEGRTDPVRVQLHEVKEDSQVNNLVTHWLARTAGDIPAFVPNTLEDVMPGIPTVPGGAYDGDAVLYVYDMNVAELPVNNTPPAENGVHGGVRSLDSYVEQVAAFLEDHEHIYVCSDACDPD